MEKKKKAKIVVGSVVLVIGLLLVLSGFNIIDIKLPGTSMMSTVGGGTHGVSVSTKSQSFPLSTIAAGYQYRWDLSASNTGSMNWDGSWVTIRLGKKGAHVWDATESGIGGVFKVEHCSYGPDTIQCRENIRDTWHIEELIGGSWQTPPGNCMNQGVYEYVCSIDTGALSAGQSITKQFRLSVPDTTEEGQYPLITNLMASAGGTYAVANQVDDLNLGTIVGSLTLAFAGLLSIISGLGILGWALLV